MPQYNVKQKLNKKHISILNSLILVPDSVPGQMMHATVKELNPWVDYEFRVVAINSVGVGEPSTPSKQIRTKAAGIPQFVVSLHNKLSSPTWEM